MLVSALITSIRYAIKDTQSSKFSGSDEILDYIQRAYEMVYQRLIEIKSDINLSVNSQSVVVGTSNYALPSDFWSLGYLHISGESSQMDQVDYPHILTYNQVFSANTDTPNRFAIYNGYFYIKPDPDTTYTMNEYYYPKPSTLATSSNMPFNDLFNRAIQRWVERMCLNRDEFNIDVEDSETQLLLRMAEGVTRRRNKSLLRVNAYRWEYEGLV